jgi:transcriptional regulator of arginine metabolism
VEAKVVRHGEQAGGLTVVPVTKAARQAQIMAILADPGVPVRSQDDLADRLDGKGLRVTQATLSRDLDELGAVRLRDRSGVLRYALPATAGLPAGPGTDQPAVEGGPAGGTGEPAEPAGLAGLSGLPPGAIPRIARTASELLLSAEASANLIVLRTPPGAAQLLASTIDLAGWRAVLGTVGGDDTVLVITRDPVGGEAVAQALRQLAGRYRRTAGTAGED